MGCQGSRASPPEAASTTLLESKPSKESVKSAEAAVADLAAQDDGRDKDADPIAWVQIGAKVTYRHPKAKIQVPSAADASAAEESMSPQGLFRPGESTMELAADVTVTATEEDVRAPSVAELSPVEEIVSNGRPSSSKLVVPSETAAAAVVGPTTEAEVPRADANTAGSPFSCFQYCSAAEAQTEIVVQED